MADMSVYRPEIVKVLRFHVTNEHGGIFCFHNLTADH